MPSLFNTSLMAFSTTTGGAAAETPASFMHRTLSLERTVQSFYESQTGKKELSLESLTSFMDEALLKNGPMSFSEHTDYHPIIDELVFYVTQWHEQHRQDEEIVSNNQAQILLTFGLAYEIEDAKFWRITKQLCEESLIEVK